MLNFKKEQQQAFSNVFVKKFEDEMVAHIKEFFPNHYFAIGEHGTRSTIKYGYEQAKKYGFETERDVCLYLNTMIFFGSNFDTDTQYPWAQTILKGSGNNLIKFSDINKLADNAEEKYEQIAGPNQIYLNAAYKNMLDNHSEIFKKIVRENLNDSPDFLQVVFPEKYKEVGNLCLQQMVKLGTQNAKGYGFRVEPDICKYIVFMFLFGSGFNKDPQFLWAGKILENASIDTSKKTGSLYQAGINWLEAYILNLNN